MYCSNCGTQSAKKICKECLMKGEKNVRFCRWCGSELEKNAVACGNCKEKIKPQIALTVFRAIVDIPLIGLFAIFLLLSFSFISMADYFFAEFLIAAVGLALSLPLMRKILYNKTHKNHKLRALLRILRRVLTGVMIIAYLLVFTPATEDVDKRGKYREAISILETDPLQAHTILEELDDYKDSASILKEAEVTLYEKAGVCLREKSFDEAKHYLEALPDGYEDPLNLQQEIPYQAAKLCIEKGNYLQAKDNFLEIKGYKDVDDILEEDIFALIGNKYDVELKVKQVGYNLVYNHERLSFDGEKVDWHTATYKKTPYASSYVKTESIDNELNILVKDESIYLSMNDKDVKLTVVNYEKGRVLAFLWNGSLFKLTE